MSMQHNTLSLSIKIGITTNADRQQSIVLIDYFVENGER